MSKVEKFMQWISKVHGKDVLDEVTQKAGSDASLENLSAELQKVLLRKHAEKKETELSSECDDLIFDNDLMIP